MILTFGNTEIAVKTFTEASRHNQSLRESCAGEMPRVSLIKGNKIYRVASNSKIFDGDKLIYAPKPVMFDIELMVNGNSHWVKGVFIGDLEGAIGFAVGSKVGSEYVGHKTFEQTYGTWHEVNN